MPRAIASLTLSFGLVSIPVKLFSATEASSAVRFKLMRADGVRVRQQYVSDVLTDERPERVTSTPSNPKRSSREDSPLLAQSSYVRELRAAGPALIADAGLRSCGFQYRGPDDFAAHCHCDAVAGCIA